MGNHLAPPFAIIFMDWLEELMLSTAKAKPVCGQLFDGMDPWGSGITPIH